MGAEGQVCGGSISGSDQLVVQSWRGASSLQLCANRSQRALPRSVPRGWEQLGVEEKWQEKLYLLKVEPACGPTAEAKLDLDLNLGPVPGAAAGWWEVVKG